MQLIFKLEGRLGNHFYILAAMIYVIKKYKNIDVKLFINEYVKVNNINHIYKNFNEYIIDELPDNYEDIYESFDNNGDSTFDLDQFINEHINYEVPIIFNFCFFQINKYFLEYKDDVKKIFLVETDNTLKYKNIISEDDVFISVRRGDYIEAHFHVLTAEYYIDMYNIYFSGKNIYISSDDIDWCKENLILEKFNNCNNITYLENLDFLELYTIGTYFKNYICANSTFSAAVELSSDHNQKSIGIKNISANICRNNMFSKNCTICDITNESNYNKYIEKIKFIV